MPQMWTGMNVFLWEHRRKFGDLANQGFEMCRADNALLVPGFQTLSVFLRRESQSVTGTFTLYLWTAPLFTRLLDEDLAAAPEAQLLKLTMAPATGLSTGASGQGAQVFGAQIASGQAMGSLLFWQMKNETGSTANLVGDIYVVPNHNGSMMLDRIGRTLDGPTSSGPSMSMTGSASLKVR